MLQFILTNVFLISLGAFIFLMIRALPRIGEEPTGGEGHTIFERWVMSEVPHRIDAALNASLWKLFRKTKVIVMRLDNYLTDRLKKISHQTNGGGLNGNGKPKIDFSDLFSGNASNEKGTMGNGAEDGLKDQ